MILTQGNKLLLVHRRLFEEDHSRFFIGTVDGYENGIAKVRGETWVHDPFDGLFKKKKDERTKIFSLMSGSLIVYQIPKPVELKEVELKQEPDGSVRLTDGKDFDLDLSETLYHFDVHRRRRHPRRNEAGPE